MTDHMELTGDLGDGLRLKKALPIEVQAGADWTGTFVVASESTFANYGVGDTQDEALEDLRTSLGEYYRLVEQGAGEYEDDRRELARLREYIEEIAP